MIRRPPRSTQSRSSAASDVYKRQTVIRVLESIYQQRGEIVEQSGVTNIFIYPGFQFQVINAMITNFHIPRSTLFMLVCAFAGTEFMKAAYRGAVEKHYRFFSFGDATFIM